MEGNVARLNRISEDEIAEAIIDVMDKQAIPAEEAIPGLILAVKELANYVDGQVGEVLEEAADLLADN